MKFIFYYYLLINILLFIIMYIDKQRAIKKLWRIKEQTLFIFYLLGGFIGGILSMFIFHHKTKKLKFYFIFIISTLIHTFLFVFLYKKL